jgi:hypothetical protein
MRRLLRVGGSALLALSACGDRPVAPHDMGVPIDTCEQAAALIGSVCFNTCTLDIQCALPAEGCLVCRSHGPLVITCERNSLRFSLGAADDAGVCTADASTDAAAADGGG